MDYTRQIQEIASKLFTEEKIDIFIGYRKNSFDDNQVPVLITRAADVDRLVFDDRSAFNLTNVPEVRTYEEQKDRYCSERLRQPGIEYAADREPGETAEPLCDWHCMHRCAG